jgi:uncharacterized membrane protein
MLRQLLLLLHLLGVISWIGGMFFAYFCLRPAAAEVLKPPERLPLWAATFARFLPYMAVAVALIVVTGVTLLVTVGFAAAPLGWHVMFAVFAYVYLRLFPELRLLSGAAEWASAAVVLNRIRQLVALNLVLGLVAIASAVSAR